MPELKTLKNLCFDVISCAVNTSHSNEQLRDNAINIIKGFLILATSSFAEYRNPSFANEIGILKVLNFFGLFGKSLLLRLIFLPSQDSAEPFLSAGEQS